MSDFLSVSSIQESLQSGNSNDDLSKSLAALLPPDIFVVIAAVFGSATLSKSYFQMVHSMIQSQPKLMAVIYVISAWLLSLALGYIAFLIGLGELDIGNGKRVAIHLAMANIQVIRWSLLLG